MARAERKDQPTKSRRERAPGLEGTGEVGGFEEEARRGQAPEAPRRPHGGRTLGATATSYSSVGGTEQPNEWPADATEFPAGAEAQTGESLGPVHDVTFRPAPGGYVETPGQRGKHIPFTGEVSSTRDSNFEEDPNTGRTAVEEEYEFVRESLEERTRGYESG